MLFAEYLKKLNHMAKKFPEILELPVIAIEGIECIEIDSDPSAGIIINEEYQSLWKYKKKRTCQSPTVVLIN